MHLLTNRISQTLETFGITADKRASYTAFMLAQAISVSLPLPSSPVSSIDHHYNEKYLSTVNKLVSEFNEYFVVSTSEIVDLVRKCYRHRYRLVYAPTLLEGIQLMSTVFAMENDATPPMLTELQCNINLRKDSANLRALVSDLITDMTNRLGQ